MGRVALEPFERHAVEALHRVRDDPTGFGSGRADADPGLIAVAPVDGSTDVGGRLVDDGDGFGEPAWRAPRADPAVAVVCGADERGVRPAADHQGNGADCWFDRCGVEIEELAVVVNGFAVGQPAQNLQAFIGSTAPASRVDTADLDLVAVVPADADTERNPSRCETGHGRHLPGHGHRMAKRQEVDTDHDSELVVELGEAGDLDESVGAVPVSKRDVVGHVDVVDTGGEEVVEYAVLGLP